MAQGADPPAPVTAPTVPEQLAMPAPVADADTATPDAPALTPPVPDALPSTLPQRFDVDLAPEVAVPRFQPPHLRALSHAAHGLSDLATSVLAPILPLPVPLGAESLNVIDDRFPLPAPQAVIGDALPQLPVAVLARYETLPFTLPATIAQRLGDALGPLWTPAFAAFLNRLWPMLIPLALFLTVLATWRASLREAREPTEPEAATHPLVLPGGSRFVVPEAESESWLEEAEALEPAAGVMAQPPSAVKPEATTAPPAARPAAQTAEPQRSTKPEAPRAPPKKPAPRRAPAAPRASANPRVPPAPTDPATGFPLAAMDAAPALRPGVDPPIEIDGLEDDEVLTILAAAPAAMAPQPDISVAPAPGRDLVRILLGDDCIAVVKGVAKVDLDQINLILTDPPEPTPPACDDTNLARVIPIDVARANRRARAARQDDIAARSRQTPEAATQQTEEITFDLDLAFDEDAPFTRTPPPDPQQMPPDSAAPRKTDPEPKGILTGRIEG